MDHARTDQRAAFSDDHAMMRSEGGTKHCESTGLGKGVEIARVKISQR